MKEYVGVVGSGVMGSGVAQAFAQCGYETILIDKSSAQLERAEKKIRENLRFQKLFIQSDKQKDADSILRIIHFTNDYGELKKADFIVENVTEDWNIKKDVYKKLMEICKDECVFGVNTSAISITRVGSVCKKPENVIGMHFMNPVPLKKTVEVIKGVHTSEDTVNKVKKILSGIGKEGIVINDSVGFVTNRAMMIFVNEAVFMLQEGVAGTEEIDTLFIKCFGHKMGPLQTADLIGVDTILKSLEVLYEGYNDSKYRPCPLLKKMTDAGLLGMKSGKGFYDYTI
jgi:3-hydroxybutyryl-CoA dehydrogenase